MRVIRDHLLIEALVFVADPDVPARVVLERGESDRNVRGDGIADRLAVVGQREFGVRVRLRAVQTEREAAALALHAVFAVRGLRRNMEPDRAFAVDDRPVAVGVSGAEDAEGAGVRGIIDLGRERRRGIEPGIRERNGFDGRVDLQRDGLRRLRGLGGRLRRGRRAGGGEGSY